VNISLHQGETVKLDGEVLAIPDNARTMAGELTAAARDILTVVYDFPRCSWDIATSSRVDDLYDFFGIASGLLSDQLIEILPHRQADKASQALVASAHNEVSSIQTRDGRINVWFRLFQNLESSAGFPSYMLSITNAGKRELESAIENVF
jgi:hypothetical protein